MATVTGGSGDDNLNGTAGADDIQGNGGDDTIDAGGGSDTIDGGDGNDYVDGGSGADTITGGAGDDTLYGRQSGDTLDGGAGNDLVDGGAGADILSGGDGDDTMIGGGSAGDIMTGGAGNDTFVIVANTITDIITDFDLGDDNADGKYNDQLDLSRRTDGTGPDGQITLADLVVQDDGFGNAQLLFPSGDTVVLEGVSPAQFSSAQQMQAAGIPCFTPGTLIDTARGPVVVERLRPGDLVRTQDRGWKPVRWIGCRTLGAADLEAQPNLRPVVIRKGALGNARRMLVSPQHGFLFGGRLVRAKHLAETFGGKVARVDRKATSATYVHFLCDRHEIVFAEGTATESLYPGPIAMRTMGPSALAELLLLFPKLARGLTGKAETEAAYGPPARTYMTGRELRHANIPIERLRHPGQQCSIAA
ncbi:MAG: Hint domain-containing protein [Paracoccaceae bacterium]